jgi:hypothetical protein
VRAGVEGRYPVRRGIGAAVWTIGLLAVVAGCSRPSAGNVEPTPTYIAQPTPDATMSAVIEGRGSPVAYYAPLEVRGSPTPIPAAARPAPPASTSSRAVPKPAAPARESAPAREAAPVREAAPTTRPAPTNAPTPRPAPTAPRPASSGAGAAPAPAGGGSNPAPSIINPATLPGGVVRPNPTPAR